MRPAAPWAVLDIDLENLPQRLAPPCGANAVMLVYRCRGAVLGTQVLLPENAALGRDEIATQAALSCWHAVAHLLRLEGRAEAAWTPAADPAPRTVPEKGTLARLGTLIDARRHAAPGLPSASVVVCTRGRPAELAECLTAIAAAAPACHEVVVVDNGPDEATRAVAAAHPCVRYVAEPVPGLSAARNAAIAAACGEIAVFVDDDVRPEPGWLAPLLARFDRPEVAVVCGLVLPAALETEAEIRFQFDPDAGFGGMGALPQVFDRRFVAEHRTGVPVWEVGAGANMAVRRRAIVALGGFDERLGPGAAGGCGDDSELWHRALFAGYTLVYEPSSVVRHHHRRDLAALRRQVRGYGLGHVAALFAQYRRDRDRGDLVRAFVRLPAWLFGRAARALWRGRWRRQDLLLWPFCKGYLAGLRQLPLTWRAPPPSVFEGRLRPRPPAGRGSGADNLPPHSSASSCARSDATST